MFDESEPEPVTGHDTPNKTKFHEDDANYPQLYRLDGIRKFEDVYRRLKIFNVGTYSYQWGDNAILRKQDNLAILDAVANSLELTEYQSKVARTIMDRAPLSKWSSPDGIDAYLVAICVCAVILRNDLRTSRAYHPNRNDENNDSLFLELLEGLDYRDTSIRRCYQKTRNRVQWESQDWRGCDVVA